MAGTISFGGIGSGLDVEGIVSGLVSASRGPINALNARTTTARAAASEVSQISSLLSNFATAVRGLDELTETKSYTASSSSDSVAVSATGAAQPGSYGVKVLALASEARVYSNPEDSTTDPLTKTGTLEFSVGEESVIVDVVAGDSLGTIASKINESGLRLSATTFYDGSQHRLLINGMDKGSDNALSIVETGLDLGLNLASNIKSEAGNAKVEVDGFLVESQSNQITGSIPGVTLAVSKTTDSVETLTVASDPAAVRTKLESVVNTFNAVARKVQTVSGYGGTAASNSLLAGDSTLRTLAGRMSNAVMTRTGSGSAYDSLTSIGMSIGRDGTLSFDASKFDAALAADPNSVSDILAGDGSADGIMDTLRDMAEAMTKTGTGLLTTKAETLNNQAEALEERSEREQERLNRYAEQLRTQFYALEGGVSASYADMDYLSSIYSNK